MHELNLVDVQKRYREKDAVRGFTFTSVSYTHLTLPTIA